MTSNPLDRLHNFAKVKGGKCLSKKYLGNHTHHEWLCRNGHIWKTTPSVIQQGAWCPQCNGSHRLTLDDVKAFAKKIDVEYLSSTYKNASHKNEWSCLFGHFWKASMTQMKLFGGCPACSGRPIQDNSLRFQMMRDHIEKKQGKCLSSEYKGNKDPVHVRCKDGHEFNTTYNKLMSGNQWCQGCHHEQFRIDRNKINDIVSSKKALF